MSSFWWWYKTIIFWYGSFMLGYNIRDYVKWVVKKFN